MLMMDFFLCCCCRDSPLFSHAHSSLSSSSFTMFNVVRLLCACCASRQLLLMLISCLIKYSAHSTCIRSLTIVFHLLTDHLFFSSPQLYYCGRVVDYLCRKRPWEILFPVVSNQVFHSFLSLSRRPFPFALFLSDEIVFLLNVEKEMITTTILAIGKES